MSKDSSAKFYQINKERLKKKACQKYRSLSKEEKEKSDNMVVNDRNVLSEGEKQKLFEYRKTYYKMRKNALLQLKL